MTISSVKLRIQQVRTSAKPVLHALRAFLVRLLEKSRLGEGVAYLFGIVMTLFVASFVGIALNWALARDAHWVGVAAVAVACGALMVFAALITNEQFLRDVHLDGLRWPSLLSVALAWFAITVFGGLSCAFQRAGAVSITPQVPAAEGCATRYADMYLWHLFDLIPAIQFTETLKWEQRYAYNDNVSAWLLLVFKVLVIVCVIGSFVSAGRVKREHDKLQKAAVTHGDQ